MILAGHIIQKRYDCVSAVNLSLLENHSSYTGGFESLVLYNKLTTPSEVSAVLRQHYVLSNFSLYCLSSYRCSTLQQ